jgi:hypothetical protein
MKEYKTYIIKNPQNGNYKIGKAVLPYKRISELVLISGVKYEVVMMINLDVEKKLHFDFGKKRVISEWFKLTENEILSIKETFTEFLEEIDIEMLNVFFPRSFFNPHFERF